MIYTVAADTDIGIKRKVNQDSVLVQHILKNNTEIVMAIICDGMGGLSQGELASATVINSFSDWFKREIVNGTESNIKIISDKWVLLLRELNSKMQEYGMKNHTQIGTTFTGVLFLGTQILIVHVGDTRLYYLNKKIEQLTIDQTFVARAISRGELSEEEAKKDKRRNALLQCIGASEYIEPQVIIGNVKEGGYLLCSDGFRHKITSEIIFKTLREENVNSSAKIKNKLRRLIELNMQKGETDNISAVYIDCKNTSDVIKEKKFSSKLKWLICAIGFCLVSELLVLVGIKFLIS